MKIRFENGYDASVEWIKNQTENKKAEARKLSKAETDEALLFATICFLPAIVGLISFGLLLSICFFLPRFVIVLITVCLGVLIYVFFFKFIEKRFLLENQENITGWEKRQLKIVKNLQNLSEKEVSFLYDSDFCPYSFFYKEEINGETIFIYFEIWDNCKFTSSENEEIVWNEGTVTVYGKCYKGKCHECENFEDGECTVRL